MGELLFEIKSRKSLIIIHCIIAFAVALIAIAYSVSVWTEMGTGFKIFVLFIAALCLWYGYDRIKTLKSKISFYSDGMVIHRGSSVKTLMLTDIQSYKYVQKRDEFEFIFTKTDDSTIALSSDDYENLTTSLDQYGKLVGFELRTTFQ
ncbi:DUF6585 family protein [Pedobacter nototheniae]|uniref:DUF6585 family protein n=1 Tax=Pedobacter nototheniae TaxID=2488994 RepID=UPI002930B352|nr:DUF6585 family protein [Pedobacter nototheniae]